jgi:hypothetical protein
LGNSKHFEGSQIQSDFLQAYNKAVEGSPEQPVAWEGLVKCYEKYADKKEYWPNHVKALQTVACLQKVSSTVTWRKIDLVG